MGPDFFGVRRSSRGTATTPQLDCLGVVVVVRLLEPAEGASGLPKSEIALQDRYDQASIGGRGGHQNVQSLKDLRPHLVDEIKEFFILYNRLRGRKFRPLALGGPDKSRELIESGMDAFEKQIHCDPGHA
jgi:hypothetical protein